MKRMFFAATAMTALVPAAFAQVVPVSERMANDYAPLGVRAGSFLVIPKVDFEAESNDNIYATDKNTKGDIIGRVKPEVAVQSNWSRHAVNALANASVNRYADHHKDSTTDYTVALDGRADVTRDTSIGGGVSTSKNHEDRGDPNAVASSVKPTEYDMHVARAGIYHAMGKANARFDSEVKKYDYKNGTTTAGAVIDNNVRDRTHYTQALRGGYAFTPDMEAYVKGSVDARVYDKKTAGTSRSSNGNTVVAGAVMQPTGKTKADVYAGYTKRNYNAGFKDVHTPVWGANVLWNATDLTSVMAGLNRSVEETTLAGSSAYAMTAYNLGVEHAFGRQILGTAGLAYETDDFKGVAANQRSDKITTASVGGKYIFNRCLSAGADYQYRIRNSNATGADFDRNRVLVRLTGTY